MHIPFVRMLKFKFLAQFPVDHLAHPIMSSLILFCTNFLHSLIMWLIISSLSSHNQHLIFCCVSSILALRWLVLLWAALRRNSVSLLKFPFLSHVHVFLGEISLDSRLKSSKSCFSSHFYFSDYFRSIGTCVVSIVSGGCDQFSSAHFYVVFESVYRCVNPVFNAGKSSSSFSWHLSSVNVTLGYNALCMVYSFLFSSSFV